MWLFLFFSFLSTTVHLLAWILRSYYRQRDTSRKRVFAKIVYSIEISFAVRRVSWVYVKTSANGVEPRFDFINRVIFCIAFILPLLLFDLF
jgi:hypothetical protein